VREIGADELAFSHREARLLLRTANPELTEEETAELIAVCEGWPAALYLASLSPRDRALPPSRFAGSDRYVAEYMQSELLSPLHPRDLRFLRRASILEELTAPLCDAVLHSGDSAAELKALARTNLVVVPVEEKRGCYRLPLLFRDLLLRELTEDEPQLVPTLHRRAASWYEHAGDPDSALDHANAAGDADRVASIVTAIALSASCAGRVASVERSLARFEEAQLLAEYPAVALVGAWINALGGRAADAERCLEVAERGSRRRGREAAALRPRTAVVRAALCRTGPREMLTDARAALRALARTSEWYPVALHMHGTAAMLLGSTDEARSSLAAAVEAAAAHDYSETRMIARAQLSLLARDEDDAEAAGMLTAEPREIAGTELAGRPSSAIALAAVAQTSLQQGRWADARELVTAAEPLRPLLTEALPWLAVETRLALGRCYVRLRDADGARRVVAEIDAILDARPRLGVLVEHARTLRHETAALAQEQGATAGLTPAELRLLPLLATHLSFREIADQLQVSHNTVKTQAISIYRKLGVSGRSDAIAAAAELRLRAA
jgi:LuxR family maltose regulon positive regulatory protein